MNAYSRANLALAHGSKGLVAHFRPPFRVRSASEPVIVDADDHLVAQALPGPPVAVRMLLAEAIAAGLNAQCAALAPASTSLLNPRHAEAAE